MTLGRFFSRTQPPSRGGGSHMRLDLGRMTRSVMTAENPFVCHLTTTALPTWEDKNMTRLMDFGGKLEEPAYTHVLAKQFSLGGIAHASLKKATLPGREWTAARCFSTGKWYSSKAGGKGKDDGEEESESSSDDDDDNRRRQRRPALFGSDIVSRIAKEHDLSLAMSRRVVRTVLDTIVDSVVDNKDVCFHNFGVFRHSMRMKRNFQLPSGVIVSKPRTKRISFHPSPTVRKIVADSRSSNRGRK